MQSDGSNLRSLPNCVCWSVCLTEIVSTMMKVCRIKRWLGMTIPTRTFVMPVQSCIDRWIKHRNRIRNMFITKSNKIRTEYICSTRDHTSSTADFRSFCASQFWLAEACFICASASWYCAVYLVILYSVTLRGNHLLFLFIYFCPPCISPQS